VFHFPGVVNPGRVRALAKAARGRGGIDSQRVLFSLWHRVFLGRFFRRDFNRLLGLAERINLRHRDERDATDH